MINSIENKTPNWDLYSSNCNGPNINRSSIIYISSIDSPGVCKSLLQYVYSKSFVTTTAFYEVARVSYSLYVY